MPEFELNYFVAVLFGLFVLPGFLSILVFRLFHPTDRRNLQDTTFEAIAFGAVNFALMSWTIPVVLWAFELGGWRGWGVLYLAGVLSILVAPSIWPWVLVKFLKIAEANGLILRTVNSAWDQFFLRREPCWVIVHLHDGRRIGAYFGPESFASLYPNYGHIYLEEIWQLDEQGKFERKITDSAGMVLRPEDYHIIEFKKAT